MSTPATALRSAAYVGDLVTVRRLLLEAVDPNVPDGYGRTALCHAAGRGHLHVVEELLGSGAWPDLHEDYDTYPTPLMMAASNGHLEVVQMLVAAGANPRIHSGVSQRTAEAYARSNGFSIVAKYLQTLNP
ncbi:ankyrin repeat domain-containing protein [Actomonas aquatica]|uniref:ankyrin repeat domain-containing protein n=1 Tax=Actomonas aquatica TaxID=2866162 RepID=UPI001C8254D9